MVLYIGVIGDARCDEKTYCLAETVGREIARAGAVLVCGGRGGVMEAASKGAHTKGGLVLGILPGPSRAEGNCYLTVAVPTGMGEARNALVARASDVLIAIGGGYGTLSEIALGLKMGRPVVGLGTWRLEKPGMPGPHLLVSETPENAVHLALQLGRQGQGGTNLGS